MKKNISINISGIIFHIEEDGYDSLKKYLDSVNKYFSNFEDSTEILADIESRIAEIFLTKLNEGKQVITAEDVNNLIATMGNVSDFKAAEEDTETAQAEHQQQKSEQKGSSQPSPPKRLFRDMQRKIIGGVCAGLANYFNTDPMWIRLVLALLFFAYGFGILAYIILWIVIPGSNELEDTSSAKKMFRDSERKVLGGVSGGVAAYFGIDIVIVRLIFVISSFAGGLGVVAYIVLWLILPEAKSLTDKMQMQGEPVTLSNIESTIKKNTGNETGEESTLTKIILFPFRLIAMIINALGKIIRPIVDFLRVSIGVFIAFIGILLVLSVLVSGGILIGILSVDSFHWLWGNEISTNLPVEAMSRAISPLTGIAGFFFALIPSLAILFTGASIIASKSVIKTATGWTMFVVFFISVGVLSLTIPGIVYSFKEEGSYKIENTYPIVGKPTLRLNNSGSEDYDVVHFWIEGYEGSEVKIVQEFEAQGASRAKAVENAKMVTYNIAVKDSVYTFDSNLTFKPDAIFRVQRLDLTLFVPYDQEFILEEGMEDLLSMYIPYDKRDGQGWKITRGQSLTCATCPAEEDLIGSLRDFDEIDISGAVDVTVVKGDRYNVSFSEGTEDNYRVYTEGSTLRVDLKDDEWNWRKNIRFKKARLTVTMPSLTRFEFTGVGDVTLDNIRSEYLTIESLGAAKINCINLRIDNLTVDISGATELTMSGKGSSMDADVSEASKLAAFDYVVESASVSTQAAAKAQVFVTERLDLEEYFPSKIEYRGGPQVNKRN